VIRDAQRRFYAERDDYVQQLNEITELTRPMTARMREIEKEAGGWWRGKEMPSEWGGLSLALNLLNDRHRCLLKEYHRFFVRRRSALRVPASEFGRGLLSGHEL
jgi:hypothetical protein